MNRIKLVVINEHTLGYIIPTQPNQYSILQSSVLKGATFELYPEPKSICKSDNIRLASEVDFNEYRVSFLAFGNEKHYKFKS